MGCGGRSSTSRAGLAKALGARPNSVGDAVAGLLERGVLESTPPEVGADAAGTSGVSGGELPGLLGAGVGRPGVLLRIAAGGRVGGRTVLGVAVQGAQAQVRAVNLSGRSVGPVWRGLREEAAAAVEAMLTEGKLPGAGALPVLGLGVALPGLVEVESSADANHGLLAGLKASCSGLPVVVDNDGHALAARWWLTQGVARAAAGEEGVSEDVLLIRLGDGVLGASVLIGGRPNRGCVIGGNELGHTRLAVETPRCFCGQRGCLERIASTAFLHSRGASTVRTLAELCSAYAGGTGGDDRAVSVMVDLLGMGISNAVQLLRPHRVVVVSELSRFAGFYGALMEATRGRLLPALARRVVFEVWDEPLSSPAESAAHLALAAVYDAAWARS